MRIHLRGLNHYCRVWTHEFPYAVPPRRHTRPYWTSRPGAGCRDMTDGKAIYKPFGMGTGSGDPVK